MTPMVIKIIVIMAVMYFVFARLCIHSTRLYRADLGHSYTPAASLRQHPAGASVAKALVIAPETPRPSQEGHQLPSRHLRERPQPPSRKWPRRSSLPPKPSARTSTATAHE